MKISLLDAMPQLSKHELEALTMLMRQHYMKKFKRRSTPKYGNLNKGFTESEIQTFFKVIKEDKFVLLFKYEAQLGLRVGEVIRLNQQKVKV